MGLLRPWLGLGTVAHWTLSAAKTEAGHAFTLCRCTAHGFAIYATYLVCGDITEDPSTELTSDTVTYPNGFLTGSAYKEPSAKQLNWTTLAEHFSVEVTDGAQRLALSSKYFGSRDQVGEIMSCTSTSSFSFDHQKATSALRT